jgi:hypothetical protein
MSIYQPAVSYCPAFSRLFPNVQLSAGCFLMSSYRPAVSSPFKAGPQAEMRRGDISHCQPHSNYASLNLIPFTLHLSLSFQCPILRTFSTSGPCIPFPPFYFFSVSNSTFSTFPPFTLNLSFSFQFTMLRTLSTTGPFPFLLSISFQFPILPSQPSLHSLSIFLFLFSFQFYLLNHTSFHSPPLSLPLFSFHFSLKVRSCQSPPFQFLPFPLSLCSLQSPFTSLQNLSWEVRQCPKRTSVHICRVLYLKEAVRGRDLLIQEVQNTR